MIKNIILSLLFLLLTLFTAREVYGVNVIDHGGAYGCDGSCDCCPREETTPAGCGNDCRPDREIRERDQNELLRIEVYIDENENNVIDQGIDSVLVDNEPDCNEDPTRSLGRWSYFVDPDNPPTIIKPNMINLGADTKVYYGVYNPFNSSSITGRQDQHNFCNVLMTRFNWQTFKVTEITVTPLTVAVMTNVNAISSVTLEDLPAGYQLVGVDGGCRFDAANSRAYPCSNLAERGVRFLISGSTPPTGYVCQDWTDINVEGCAQANYSSNDPSCLVYDAGTPQNPQPPTVDLNLNVTDADEMGFIEIGSGVQCSTASLPSQLTVGPTGYLSTSSITLNSTTRGERQVCGRFTDNDSNSTAQCGGKIKYVGCNLNLPSDKNIPQGIPYPISASISNEYPSVSQVSFEVLDNPNITVSPLSDPFSTSIDSSGAAINEVATIRATATMAYGTATCEDEMTVKVVEPRGWWQTIDADVTSGIYLESIIPIAGESFSQKPSYPGGFSGIPVSNSYSFGIGNASEDGWNAYDNTLAGIFNYDYLYFRSKVPSEIEDKWGEGLGVKAGGESFEAVNLYGESYVDGPSGPPDYPLNGWMLVNGDLTIEGSGTGMGNGKVVIFVDGDLNIKSDISLDTKGFLMAIVRDSINIESTVTSIEGIYVANIFDSGHDLSNDDIALNIRGSVIADTVDFNRDLGDINNLNFPAEVVEYAPDLFLRIPFEDRKIVWKEVAP